jgi:hypothetical protein
LRRERAITATPTIIATIPTLIQTEVDPCTSSSSVERSDRRKLNRLVCVVRVLNFLRRLHATGVARRGMTLGCVCLCSVETAALDGVDT